MKLQPIKTRVRYSHTTHKSERNNVKTQYASSPNPLGFLRDKNFGTSLIHKNQVCFRGNPEASTDAKVGAALLYLPADDIVVVSKDAKKAQGDIKKYPEAFSGMINNIHLITDEKVFLKMQSKINHL